MMLKNLLGGARIGLSMGVLLSCWVGILALVSGSLEFRSRGGSMVAAPAVVALYLVGGLVVGSLLGLARPLLRIPFAAVLIGMLAALPLGAGVMFIRSGFVTWSRPETIVTIIFAIAFGGPGGLIVRGFLLSSERYEKRGSS